MKVLKTVLILSLAILSLGSSVAFGECPMTKSSDAQQKVLQQDTTITPPVIKKSSTSTRTS